MSSYLSTSQQASSCTAVGDDEDPNLNSLIHQLDFSLWLIIGKFLGFSETQRNFSQVCKAFYYYFERSKLDMSPLIQDGHLIELSGRMLSEILDVARYSVYAFGLATISPAASKLLEGGIMNMHLLRRGYMGDLASLNVGVYSYWDHLGSAPEGVFDYIKITSKANPHCLYDKHIESDVVYWRTSRMFGDFYVVCSRADGTIVASKDLKRFFLVLGLAQSLACAVTGSSTISNCFIGVTITTTLLNWSGRIVYDGLAIGHKDPISAVRKEKLMRAYIEAMNKGSIITALEKVPPVKKEVSEAPSPEALELMKVTLKPLLRNIAERKQRKVDLRVALPNNPMDTWVFRRQGYSEPDNPDQMLSVFTAEGPLLQFHRIKSFHVTTEEVIQILDDTCSLTKMRPVILMLDEISILETVRLLLAPCNIRVEYYPPPSQEERARSDMTNPYLSKQPECSYCCAATTPQGTKLLACSRCASAYYCCKEHQKLDWKNHKITCK